MTDPDQIKAEEPEIEPDDLDNPDPGDPAGVVEIPTDYTDERVHLMPTASPPTFYTLPGGGRLRGDAAASYLRMRAAGMPAGGIDVYSRTMAQQAELRRRYEAGIGPLAAKPSPTAPHIKGVAIDLQTTRSGKYTPSDAHRWLTAGGDGSSKPKAGEKLRCHPYGWRRTVPSERWHFAYDPAKDAKAAADLATRIKALGHRDVRAFQRAAGLTVDGKAGPQTWTALLLAKPAPPAETPQPPAGGWKLGDRVLKRGDSGPDVAELAALLTRAGYTVGSPADSFGPLVEAAVRAAQKSAKLTVDGKVGPKTVAALRAIPDPPAVEPGTAFRFGQANLQAQRFGGLVDTSPKRGQYLRDSMACSIYALSETTEAARDAIRKVLGATWKVYPVGYSAVLWDSAKWTHRDRMSVGFGTGIHGAIRAELVAASGRLLHVIALHARPRASFTSDAAATKGKAADVAKAAALIKPHTPTIVAGDLNGADVSALKAAGLVRATPAVDTYDPAGTQVLDQVWVSPELLVRGHTLLDPGSISDHKVWVVNLTLPGGTS